MQQQTTVRQGARQRVVTSHGTISKHAWCSQVAPKLRWWSTGRSRGHAAAAKYVSSKAVPPVCEHLSHPKTVLSTLRTRKAFQRPPWQGPKMSGSVNGLSLSLYVCHGLLCHSAFVVNSSAKTFSRSRVRDLCKSSLEKALKKQVSS